MMMVVPFPSCADKTERIRISSLFSSSSSEKSDASIYFSLHVFTHLFHQTTAVKRGLLGTCVPLLYERRERGERDFQEGDLSQGEAAQARDNP